MRHAPLISIGEADAGGFLCVEGQPALYSEFQDSQRYVLRLCGQGLTVFLCTTNTGASGNPRALTKIRSAAHAGALQCG